MAFPPPGISQQIAKNNTDVKPPTGKPPSGRLTIPLAINGMFSAGDPSSIPDAATVYLHNMLLRPNRCEARPPATYDNLMSIIGICEWEDLVNQQTRFVALDATKLYLKSASAETWDGGTSGVSGTRVTDCVSYRGKLYITLDDGAGNPTTVLVYDGSTVSASPFDSAITARAIATFNDRLFFAYPRITTTPHMDGGSQSWTGAVYDLTTVKWTKTNVTASLVTSGSNTICRLLPTSTTASSVNYGFTSSGQRLSLFQVGSGTTQSLVLRWGLRNQSASYDMPITLRVNVVTNWRAATAYGTDSIVNGGTTDINGTIQRCTTGGTSGGAAPAWATTVGATTADNTVVWTCEAATNTIGSVETTLPNATKNGGNFTGIYCPATIPSGPATIELAPQLCFFNTANPTITLGPVDVSFRDGLANGALSKKNEGVQMTSGSFFYPFVNTEGGGTIVIPSTLNVESLMWSEIAAPQTIRAVNTYQPKEEAGLPTALCTVGGRLLMWKRRAYWTFIGTADPDTPILPEGPARIGIGCLGPLAVDTLDDEVFWIGETEVWRLRIGNEPRALAGFAMREEILNRAAATWVESQVTYNMPLLAVDKKNREIWVYTQKGKLYCYHIGDEATPAVYRPFTPEQGQWTVHDINGQEIRAMRYNDITQEMEFSIGGFGLVRFDPTMTALDQIDNTANTYSVTKDITFKPIELAAPRYDAVVESFAAYHKATASQSANTLTLNISQDRGVTYPHNNIVRFDPTVARIPIAVYQFAPSVTLKLSHAGQTGAAAWAISKAEVDLNIKRGEFPQVNPTAISNSL